MVEVQILPLHPRFAELELMPTRMSDLAAGCDVRAAIDAPMTLSSGARVLVPTGFAMAIPPGYEAQVRPRSGLALKHGVTLLNSPGTIDADYRGELKVLLINHGDEPFVIESGMRIAQVVFAAVASPSLVAVTKLSDTERGEQGFGSTGVLARPSSGART